MPEQHALDAFTGIRGDVDAGLTNVLANGTAGHGYAEVSAGAAQGQGAYVRAEAGWLPRADLALYGYAEENTVQGGTAGVGARWKF